MPLDEDRVRERLRYIREQLTLLAPLGADPELRERSMRDPLRYNGIVRCLQTSVESMIDVAFHLCAKLYAKEPRNAADAFELLAQRGDLPGEFLARARGMVRFRNLVVHGYLHSEGETVERILADDLADFLTWERIVFGIAERHRSPEAASEGQSLDDHHR